MAYPPAHPNILRFGDKEVPLTVSRHPRARHIGLRLDGVDGGVRLILPPRASLREGLAFAGQKSAWLLRQLEALLPRVPFRAGAVVPYLGEDHLIRHRPDAPPDAPLGVWRGNGAIWVAGPAGRVPRRVADFLKAEARKEVTVRARAKARQIGRQVGRIRVRDLKTRWGSCGGDGHLTFSWRLILAPEAVLDYVVAHETAHLREMHHGPRFWALAGRLTGDVSGARRWLGEHGGGLHRFG